MGSVFVQGETNIALRLVLYVLMQNKNQTSYSKSIEEHLIWHIRSGTFELEHL